MKREFKCLRNSVIEVSEGSVDAVQEIKSLIKIIGKPVSVKFKGKTIQITSDIPAYKVVEFWRKLSLQKS